MRLTLFRDSTKGHTILLDPYMSSFVHFEAFSLWRGYNLVTFLLVHLDVLVIVKTKCLSVPPNKFAFFLICDSKQACKACDKKAVVADDSTKP